MSRQADSTSDAVSLRVVEVVFARHLTLEALVSALGPAEQAIVEATRADVIVDCRAMEGYDVDARAAFVEWNTRMRSKVAHLAVLTDRPMWHLVVSGMALASGQTMKAFADRPAALTWFKGRTD